MTKDSKSNFEISNLELAQESVEQARRAVENFFAAGRRVAAAWEGERAVAERSAKNATHKAMELAEQNIAKWFEFTEKVVRAKNAQEVLQIQGDFVRTQTATLHDYAQELERRTA